MNAPRAAGPVGDDPRTEQLARRRDEVRAQLHGLETELAALRVAREGRSDDDEHDPDGVPLSTQWDQLEGLKQAKLTALATIEEALERAEHGQDERCRSCGRPIPPARLAARPEATTCIDCAD